MFQVGIPEAEVFVQLLVTIFLLDKKAMQVCVCVFETGSEGCQLEVSS